jgi:thioester reductase-like protein
VLLTGATGFLGMFLLRDLLERTSAEVICLARADDDAQARRRLERNLTESELWKAVYGDRVKILAGDLAKPLLGLPEALFEDLAGSLNAIYHCGAAVNFSQPYPLLKAANVSGTVEILRLACRGRRKTVHYVSTISVLSHEASPGKCLDESAPLICLPRQAGGYPQSKWVAERLLESARERGVPVNIYRPGTITGDSLTGVCNPDDFLYRFLRGCIAMGSAPEIEMQVDLLPVDYVSAAIVALSRRKQEAATFHLAGTQLTHIRNVYTWMRSFGLEFAIEPYLVWRRKLIDTAASLNHPLAPLIGFFPELPEGEILRVPLLPVESARTQAALFESGVTCHPPNEHLMQVYLTRTVQKT